MKNVCEIWLPRKEKTSSAEKYRNLFLPVVPSEDKHHIISQQTLKEHVKNPEECTKYLEANNEESSGDCTAHFSS